jgi:hypothetical protein
MQVDEPQVMPPTFGVAAKQILQPQHFVVGRFAVELNRDQTFEIKSL